MRWWWGLICSRPTHWVKFLIVLAHWNNSPRVDISLHSDTLFWIPAENHWPAASHWQVLSHNVVLSTPCHERNSNHNFSGDRHWLHS
jgi:hypothetical protein